MSETPMPKDCVVPHAVERANELLETFRNALKDRSVSVKSDPRDARIAELEGALRDVRTTMHNEALNQPVNSSSRWVGLYKRIDNLLSKGE